MLIFKLSVQKFQQLIVIYRLGNFVYNHWGCTSIYRLLSYPFRSLIWICIVGAVGNSGSSATGGVGGASEKDQKKARCLYDFEEIYHHMKKPDYLLWGRVKYLPTPLYIYKLPKSEYFTSMGLLNYFFCVEELYHFLKFLSFLKRYRMSVWLTVCVYLTISLSACSHRWL